MKYLRILLIAVITVVTFGSAKAQVAVRTRVVVSPHRHYYRPHRYYHGGRYWHHRSYYWRHHHRYYRYY